MPNIIFIFSVLGILLIVLRHLKDAGSLPDPQPEQADAGKRLLEKGLPAQAISKIKVVFSTTTKKVWNFILEAKDLKPHAAAGYRMKKIFGNRLPLFNKPLVQAQPQTLHEVKNEQYFLDVIKLQPKVLTNYDLLGKFYLEQGSVTDAKDIYQYLVNHQPAHADYQARLGYCFYQTREYDKAALAYQKSVALDSTQPNRYYNLGLSLEAAGKIHEAAMALKKALELEPENAKYSLALKKIKQPRVAVRN